MGLVPLSLGDLGPCLELLDVSENRLRGLPPSVGELTRLETCRIHDNPFQVGRVEVVGRAGVGDMVGKGL